MNSEFERNVVLNEIADELSDFKSESLYQCPYCEKILKWDDVNYYPEESSYTCPKCLTTFNENELQTVSLITYIEEMFLRYKGDEK
jgi:transposase-like protein